MGNTKEQRGDVYREATLALESLKNTCATRKAKQQLIAAYSAIVMAHTYEYNAKKVTA